jgi:hypothetical protein
MKADISSRYLTIRVLYPRSNYTQNILEAVRNVAEEARKFEGLIEIGAWMDKENDRIVNLTLWESKAQAMKATAAMHPKFGNIPWRDWERKPAENFIGLNRVV